MSADLAKRAPRRRFGLDTILPADSAVIEARILRLLADETPDLIVVRPSAQPDRALPVGHRPIPKLPAGVPDLLLLGPHGRTACLKIKTQAARLTRDHSAFADLCAQRGIPFAVVRSVEEASAALTRMGFLSNGER